MVTLPFFAGDTSKNKSRFLTYKIRKGITTSGPGAGFSVGPSLNKAGRLYYSRTEMSASLLPSKACASSIIRYDRYRLGDC